MTTKESKDESDEDEVPTEESNKPIEKQLQDEANEKYQAGEKKKLKEAKDAEEKETNNIEAATGVEEESGDEEEEGEKKKEDKVIKINPNLRQGDNDDDMM